MEASVPRNRIFHNAILFFRRSRMRRFLAAFPISPATTILDVGGTPLNWELLEIRPRVTLLNHPGSHDATPGDFSVVEGDGRSLPFADASFDIVFSNSVIEHVGSAADQQRFANEIRRVGRQYWVQTPNRRFPVEPHLMTPLVHFLPLAWQARILRHFTVWQMIERPTGDRRLFYVEHYLSDIRLLAAADMAALFPDAALLRERLSGLTKSLVVFKVDPRLTSGRSTT